MNLIIDNHRQSFSSPADSDQLSFSLKRSDVQKVFLFVFSFHFVIFLLAYFGLPDFRLNKRPDITIEIGAAPPASNGPAATNKSSARPTPKDSPKEKTPSLPKEKEGVLPSNASQPVSTQSSATSSSGVASAPTTDADYKASYLQNPKPPYPPLAFKMRLEGKVVVLAEVLADGRAGRVSLAQSSGHDLLDQSALETIKKWRFMPARKDGVIVTQAVRIPIIFSLKNR